MSESGDYDPGPWKGYSFASARRAYDSHIDRSYTDAVKASVSRADCVPDEVTTDSESPLIIACDVTGSMGQWPATIFSKLPYLDLEGKEYLGPSMQVCFAAVGDCFSDKYPLQVQPFATGTDMEATLKKLIIEGGGGGSTQESYDLAALYMLKHCNCPKAIRKPILVFIGDEGFYIFIDQDKGREWALCECTERLSLGQLFHQLQEKFSVYCVLKPYGNAAATSVNELDGTSERVYSEWRKLLGEDRIAILPEAGRVVDVIFGLLANETGRVDYFKDELKDRQGKDTDGDHKINIVLKSLNTIHIAKPKSLLKLPAPGKSITRGKTDKSKASKSLMD